MQFSDTSTSLGLIQDITFLLSGVDTTNYATADRTRNVNERYWLVWQMIFESYGGWKFQDDNLDEDPYADQTITSGTATYAVPSGSLAISMIEIKNSGGTWEMLHPITWEEFQKIGGDAAFTSNAVPKYYLLYEDTIKLIPTPNYTQASSIRVYYDRGISAFAATDTTKTPGFAAPFHRMLSIGAALDYAIAKGLKDKVIYLQQLWEDYERRLRGFYSKRYLDHFPHKIKPGRDLMEEFR